MYAPCPPPREPSRPITPTPANACDTHCHPGYGGQMYPVPIGLLKQPTDSGSSSFGR